MVNNLCVFSTEITKDIHGRPATCRVAGARLVEVHHDVYEGPSLGDAHTGRP